MNKLKTILLIDDDEATNFINKSLIRKFDITEELVIAGNGKEAMEFLQKRSLEAANGTASMPELILLDINMPVMDGFSFLKAFELLDIPDKEAIVISVLTTSLNPKDLNTVTAFGITDFLNKPLTKPALQGLMDKHYA